MFFERKSRCRKQWSRNGQEQHQMLVQMFWQILSTRTENNIHQKTWTINIFIHFPLTTESHASWGFPPQILLRRVWPRLAPRGEGGGGCEGPSHPLPPSPRGAARPRNQGQTRLAYGSGCFFDCKEIPKEYLKLLTRLGEESLDEAENVQEVSWNSMCASKRSRRMWSSPSHFQRVRLITAFLIVTKRIALTDSATCRDKGGPSFCCQPLEKGEWWNSFLDLRAIIEAGYPNTQQVIRQLVKLGALVMIHVSSTLTKMVSLQGRSLQSFDKHIKTQMVEVCKAPVLKLSLGNCSRLVGKLVELLAEIELPASNATGFSSSNREWSDLWVETTHKRVWFLKTHGDWSYEPVSPPRWLDTREWHDDMVKLLLPGNGRKIGLRCLFQKRANVNAANWDGMTPVICLASFGDVALVKLLVEKHANTNDTWQAYTALQHAARETARSLKEILEQHK